MKLKILLAVLTIFFAGSALRAQITFDVMGMHALGPGTKSPIAGARPDACLYCHAPHSGLNTGLWNQKLTTQIYTSLYTSTTLKNTTRQPTLGYDSNQCLSCHDGTVAVGTTVVYGKVTTTGTMYSWDIFGTSMAASHPFSLKKPLVDNVDIASTIVAKGKTLDPTGAVHLVNGNIECTSCHNPHIQATDTLSQNFLVLKSASGKMCLECHDPTRVMSKQVNPLRNWENSVHALNASKVASSAGVGSYPTVATTACIGCHTPHNAKGPSRILRGLNEQDCIACHNGANVSPMPAYADVFAEYGTTKIGHPLPSTSNPHDEAEATLLNNNRHATCVDCHDSHSSQMVSTPFPAPPLLRISQRDVTGISAFNGTRVLNPAINQYENCLRCHGNSTGKQTNTIYGYTPIRAVSASDPLNVIAQFEVGTPSSHPVTHVSNSKLTQPSLLANMYQLDGVTAGRVMGNQILCTDCHNSDDNREFGGAGSNGPHGSIWSHILERRYEFSKAVTPGGTVSNTYPSPDLSSAGPFALCGKCHNLSNVISGASWAAHTTHVGTDGFSCSVCHTAHGMGATSTYISGQRLVNFDLNVVASNSGAPIAYSETSNTCTLVCHGVAHDTNGPTLKHKAPVKK